jgi:hypothetical protein
VSQQDPCRETRSWTDHSKPAMRRTPAPSPRHRSRGPRAASRERGTTSKKEFIPFRITVGEPMTREEFEAAANVQVFGTVEGNVRTKLRFSERP